MGQNFCIKRVTFVGNRLFFVGPGQLIRVSGFVWDISLGARSCSGEGHVLKERSRRLGYLYPTLNSRGPQHNPSIVAHRLMVKLPYVK